MKVVYMGKYSQQGLSGMLDSSYAKRVEAVRDMFAKVDATLGDVMYLMGEYDVFATVEISSIEVAAGVRDIMMQSDGWDKLLMMPEFDVDAAIQAARTVGNYPTPGSET
ncbi:GYD domain-containing protein [Rhodobacteraceae bacterium]|nr:GYD domain-containing protein [Paracoccaceae bacterium]